MFHLCVKVCSKRSAGKSSVAAAAYRACETIVDDRTGITHDFTKKGGHVYGEINLCENAPAEYQDRATLWNAVEKIEKNKNAQTSREVEVSLPVELDLSNKEDLEEAKDLLRRYIDDNFVSKGMCADWNIHNPDEDNHNPHCHIQLTMRPIKENGEWGDKEKKVYKLDDDGNRVPVLDVAKVKKFEKDNGKTYEEALSEATTPEQRDNIIFAVQKIGAKNRRMWERETVDKTGWNEQSLCEEWRKDWADKENELLERLGFEDRVDHRSYERQGIDKVPSIHEGVANHLFERTDGNEFSDRIYQNVKIEEINTEMSVLEKFMAFCKDKIEIIKDRIEAIKDKVVDSIEDTKDFLAGLVRGDISDRTRETDGTTSHRRGSPGLRPAFAGEGQGTIEERLSALESPGRRGILEENSGRTAELESKFDGQSGNDLIRELRAERGAAKDERRDRDDAAERLEAERADRERTEAEERERLDAERDERNESKDIGYEEDYYESYSHDWDDGDRGR